MGIAEKKISEEEVLAMIASQEVMTVGKKTTVVLTTLTNGFEIVTSSSAVDPAQYDQEVGAFVAKKRAYEKIWELEGYKLQASLTTEDAPPCPPEKQEQGSEGEGAKPAEEGGDQS